MIIDYAASIVSAIRNESSSISDTNSGADVTDFTRTYFGFKGTQANSISPFVLTFASQSHIGVCGYIRTNRTDIMNDNLDFLDIYDVSGNKVFSLNSKATGLIYAVDYTEASPVTSTLYATMTNDTWLRVDININIAVSGSVVCTLGGTEVYNKSGDTTLSGALTAIDRVDLTSGNTLQGGITPTFHYRGVIVTDGEDTIGLEMFQHTLTANGAHTDMTGGYTDLNSDDLQDLNFVLPNALNDVSTFVIDDIPTGGTLDGYDVVGFAVCARAQTKQGANLALVIDDGTNSIEGASHDTELGLHTIKEIFATAPDNTAWTKAKVNGTEIGIKNKV
ncbi:hypothetical protein RBG11_004248 [Vibrio parahaemolyticus]|nr:hypothetical protein [Vibrio parahaemolyticus]